MNTTFLGQREFIKHGCFLFLLSDESCFAVNNIESGPLNSGGARNHNQSSFSQYNQK